MITESIPSGPPVRVVAHGIDALYMSGWGLVPGSLVDRLQASRAGATRHRRSVEFDFGGEAWTLQPHGWGKYRYSLERDEGRIGLTTSGGFPAVRVQPRSWWLQQEGATGAVDWFRLAVAQELREVTWTASRVDLFGDVQGWAVDELAASAMTRSRRRQLHLDGQTVTGLSLGRRGSGYARIYDKSALLRHQPADGWWHQVWAASPDYVPGAAVTRIEFELPRSLLVELDRSSVDAVLAGAGDLWAWCSGEWLTARTPTGDSNRSRWPISPAWSVVQAAFGQPDGAPVERVREMRRGAKLSRLLPALAGYLTSAAALLGSADLDDCLRQVGELVESYCAAKGQPFPARVAERARELPVPMADRARSARQSRREAQ